jgi:antitoxin component YwqK of YwqJK toxin-antitoxin module
MKVWEDLLFHRNLFLFMQSKASLNRLFTIYLYFIFSGFAFLQMGCSKSNKPKSEIEHIVLKDNNGFPTEIYSLKDSLHHGSRIIFFPGSKDTAVFETHENGKFNGSYRTFFSDNKIKLNGQYANNEMTGLWYQYDEGGNLLEEVTFSKNEENGPFREFFPSGKLSVSGNYKNGDTEDGPLLFYNEKGKLIKKMICSGGICRTQWKDNQSTK